MTALEAVEARVSAIRSAMEAQEYDEALRLIGELDGDGVGLAIAVRRLRQLKQEAKR